MKKLQSLAIIILFALHVSTLIDAKTTSSKPSQRRHQTAKKAAARAAAQASLSNLSGQALIDALNKRNIDLAADIKKHQDNIKKITKSSSSRNVKNAQIKANKNQITSDTQEMNNNKVQIASAQKALMQATATQAQNGFVQNLQSNNTQMSPALQGDLQSALKAAYNQGQADQSATDATAISSAYNQGYNDAQSGDSHTDSSEETIADNKPILPAASSIDSSTQASQHKLICDDQSTPNASGMCADGSDAIDMYDINNDYVSSCDDGSVASCADGTSVTTVTCADQSMPDINGMCADGSLINCADGTQPACADGSQAI